MPKTEVAEVRHHSSDWCGTGVATDLYQSRPTTCHNTNSEILYMINKGPNQTAVPVPVAARSNA